MIYWICNQLKIAFKCHRPLVVFPNDVEAKVRQQTTERKSDLIRK